MIETFDVIVIGTGTMGAPACYYLAKRGCRVLGLEQFDITHEFGSHAGQSRIIRKAYFEHSDYVPLLQRAYANWKALENETGRQLYFKTGLLYAGLPHHEIIKGVKKSASRFNIELETVTDAEKIFPEFTFPENFEVLFEPEAGFVTPEQAIRLYAKQATKQGAAIHTNEKVLEWKKVGDGIEVITDKKTYRCGKMVITAGAWAGKMIPGLADKIKVTRQFVAWMEPRNENDFAINNFPCWLIADDQQPGCYYGFPVLPEEKFGRPHGLKLAHHYPASATDPDNVNRQMNDKDFLNLEYCLQKYLPGVKGKMTDYKICLYANSPDEHFIIDKLPGFEEHVCIACGFSGHGFKFASVVGEILADIITTGKTSNPIGFLNANRFI
jgi:sarcosine oxidase